MMPVHLDLILFIIVTIVFAWIGFSSARKESSANDFFHHPSLKKNAVSLIVTNITLGSGLVYLFTGAQQNGLLMLLPVLCVGLGYWLLSIFLEQATTIASRTGKNYLASINEEIEKVVGRTSYFSKTISFSLIFVFILLLAFEIFASSKVIAPFLFKQSNVTVEVILSSSIFCITVLYALLGGVKAIFGVDFLQVPLICIFIPIFIIVAIPDINQSEKIISRLTDSFKVTPSILVAIGIACINALTTQFYSLINWGAISNVELKNQKKLLQHVGIGTSAFLVIFVLVGILHPVKSSGNAWNDMMQQFSFLGSSVNFKSFIFSGIMTLGMASILLTTTDAVVVNCVLFAYDNLFGKNSKAIEDKPKSLRTIRLIGAIAFGICFITLCAINYLQPDPFYLLLSMAGGVSAFAPMIVTAGALTKYSKGLYIFNNAIVLIYFAIFAISGVFDIILLSCKSHFVPYIGLFAFLISSLISVILFFISKVKLSSQ